MCDQLYSRLYVQRKRLMSLNVQKNSDQIRKLSQEIKDLRDSGDVSQKTIDLAPYLPWR